MEYKGIQYQLVRTASPTGWKWTILFDDNRTKEGQQANRVEAIAKAERAIDLHLRARRLPVVIRSPDLDEGIHTQLDTLIGSTQRGRIRITTG